MKEKVIEWKEMMSWQRICSYSGSLVDVLFPFVSVTKEIHYQCWVLSKCILPLYDIVSVNQNCIKFTIINPFIKCVYIIMYMIRICKEENVVNKYFRPIYSFINQIPNWHELLIIYWLQGQSICTLHQRIIYSS